LDIHDLIHSGKRRAEAHAIFRRLAYVGTGLRFAKQVE
jgi:hypothetical protein